MFLDIGVKDQQTITSSDILTDVNFGHINRPDFCANVQQYVPPMTEETVIVEEISQDATEKWLDTLGDSRLEHLKDISSNTNKIEIIFREIVKEPVIKSAQETLQIEEMHNESIKLYENSCQETKECSSKKLQKIVCKFCNKTFVGANKLNWHMRMHDNNRKRFICPMEECGRIYASKQSCDLHYKQTHLDEGFLCDICQKIFAAKQTLEVHMRYHTKEFPYKCTICERKFAQKGHLTQHIEVKHQNLRYICPEPECGKIFQNSVSLRNHNYTHSSMPFKCSHCDKQFPQKNKLRDHLSQKHNLQYSLSDLEEMRQFNIIRTRHAFVKVQANDIKDLKHNNEESVLDNISDVIQCEEQC